MKNKYTPALRGGVEYFPKGLVDGVFGFFPLASSPSRGVSGTRAQSPVIGASRRAGHGCTRTRCFYVRKFRRGAAARGVIILCKQTVAVAIRIGSLERKKLDRNRSTTTRRRVRRHKLMDAAPERFTRAIVFSPQHVIYSRDS